MSFDEKQLGTINKVCVVGLGYIGLPTAAFIADSGISVLGVDINESHVEKINKGEMPFFEPGFEALLKSVVADGNLKADTEVAEADAFIVAVPTPFNDDYSVNMSYIEAAAKNIAPVLRPGALVVLESTSPPGTTEKMAEILLAERPDLSTDPESANRLLVAHCPERVLPGKIMEEMAANDRVIGGLNPLSTAKAEQLYSSFCNGEMLLTNATTAEMAKLTENSFRDVNIAFANELSIISDKLRIDVWELIELANHHPRVNILNPGPGVGGHCIAVDPWFIVSSAQEEAKLIRTAREVNDGKPAYVIAKITEAVEAEGAESIAALGIAFKPDIDDLRESPALSIVQQMAEKWPEKNILVAEPNVDALPESLTAYQNVQLVDASHAISSSPVVAVLVDHTPFKSIEKSALEGKNVVDTRGMWS
ncbi:MAG: UDP-N-acetyl-D-mannosamine dehydrogenase [Corynebacterium sp.]|uniref:UDP-N-acetyl-D-mannosamine dehydrogenase n=1 Tax=Corynebacterium sp. TaxID=1720 RepID=UPI00257D7316|nr:UDP-N-acetyl-D-mannosamine dehydrogenase [Corynebacterium sp.]MDU2587503.1 UDP-N-acetyl-D-mannosamine dehydrogenase [Corynebacterium sp.]